VGLGAGLLLNLGPDRRGLIDDADAARLAETVDELRRRFADPIAAELRHGRGEVTATFPGPVGFDHLELREDLSHGQFVDAHEILADGRRIASGRTIGIRRWHAFETVTASSLTIRYDSHEARLRGITAFHTGHTSMPELERQPESAHPSKFDPDPA
jgi:alpha-L-fucosidase